MLIVSFFLKCLTSFFAYHGAVHRLVEGYYRLLDIQLSYKICCDATGLLLRQS